MSFLIILASNSLAIGQSKLSVNGGIGFPELINIGAQYNTTDNFGIGFGVGYFPLGNEEIAISVYGDLSPYFGKPSKISDRPVWFVKIGLHYHHHEAWKYYYDDPYKYSKSFFLKLRIGRDIYITKRFGFKFELGGVFHHVYKDTLHFTLIFFDGESPPILPSLGVALYYRL